MPSITCAREKQVYMLAWNGAEKYITKVNLKDVPLLERIKNVFGFGAMNLGKIVDYCLKAKTLHSDFEDIQDISIFMSALRNDYRMRNPDNSSNVSNKFDHSELALNRSRAVFSNTLQQTADVREEQGYDVSHLRSQAKILSSPNPHLAKKEWDGEIVHGVVNQRTKMREGLLSKLQKTTLDVSREYRFQLATILISMNALSRDERNSFISFLAADEAGDLRSVERGEIDPFELCDYDRLKELDIPPFDKLPADLQQRSQEFLIFVGSKTSTRLENEALHAPRPSPEQLKKLCK